MDTEWSVKLADSDEFLLYDFPEDLLKVFQDYVELNRHLLEIDQLFQVFNFNIEQLTQSYVIHSSDSIERMPNFITEHTDFISINALTINILSSGRTLVESIEACIKNTYEESTDERQKFNEYRSKIYDENFAYRFFWILRNFSQHQHLPVSVNKTSYCFDIWQILHTPHFDMKKSMGEELQKFSDEIQEKYNDNFRLSFYFSIAQYTMSVTNLHLRFWECIQKKLLELNETIDDVVKENPKILDHVNDKFNGNIIYLTSPDGKDEAQLFHPNDNAKSYISSKLNEAQSYYDVEKEKYEQINSSFKYLD